MKPLYFILLLISVFTLHACDIINPAEEIPAYIYITKFDFTVDVGEEGSGSTKIVDAWVNVGGDFLGAYTLPALVPVLAKGNQTITLNPGIKDNGVLSTPEIYPFYEPYEIQVDLAANEVDTIRPTSSYLNGIQFGFIEDFERENHIFRDDLDGNEETSVQLTTTEVFEGNSSAHIFLQKETPFIEVATISRFRNLMERGVFVYLEVNYKSDIPVLFGIVGHQEGILNEGRVFYDPGFSASDDWNKIYFNITSLLFEQDYPEYQFSIQAILPLENGEFTQESANIYLDNIKLVYF